MADSDWSSSSALGRHLATTLAAASDSQRAALPSVAAAGRDAATTAQSLATAADAVPPAAQDSASKQIKRRFAETEDAGSAAQCCSRGDGSKRAGVDYQGIPDEEYWRYNRYLDKCAAEGKTPQPADPWQVKSVQMRANNAEGYGFESEVRRVLQVPVGKGSRPVTTKEGFVPDLPVGEQFGVTDIKNVATLNDSDQLTAFHGLAKEKGLPFNLIVGPNTNHISAPLLNRVRDTGGVVDCYDPIEDKFTRLDIGTAGYWKR